MPFPYIILLEELNLAKRFYDELSKSVVLCFMNMYIHDKFVFSQQTFVFFKKLILEGVYASPCHEKWYDVMCQYWCRFRHIYYKVIESLSWNLQTFKHNFIHYHTIRLFCMQKGAKKASSHLFDEHRCGNFCYLPHMFHVILWLTAATSKVMACLRPLMYFTHKPITEL